MKKIIVLTFCILFGKTFSQNTLFWFQPNIYNPATAGFFNKFTINHSNALSYQHENFQHRTSTNYNQYLKKLHGGIGLTHQGSGVTDFIGSNLFKVNYAFHFKIKAIRSSIGTSFGQDRRKFYDISPTQGFIVLKSSNLILSLGNVTQFKSHTFQSIWNYGFKSESVYYSSSDWQFMYSYDWKMNEDFSTKFNVRYLRSGGNNFLYFSPLMKYKITWLNIGLSSNGETSIGAGVDLKEKFRLGLNFNSYYYQGNGFGTIFSGVILSYRIKNDN